MLATPPPHRQLKSTRFTSSSGSRSTGNSPNHNSSMNKTWSPAGNISNFSLMSPQAHSSLMSEEQLNDEIEERMSSLKKKNGRKPAFSSAFTSPVRTPKESSSEPIVSQLVVRYSGEQAFKKKYWIDQGDRLHKMATLTKTLMANPIEERRRAIDMMKALDDVEFIELSEQESLQHTPTSHSSSSQYKHVEKRVNATPRTVPETSYPKYQTFKSPNNLTNVQSRFRETPKQDKKEPSRRDLVTKEREERISKFTHTRETFGAPRSSGGSKRSLYSASNSNHTDHGDTTNHNKSPTTK